MYRNSDHRFCSDTKFLKKIVFLKVLLENESKVCIITYARGCIREYSINNSRIIFYNTLINKAYIF